MELLISNQFLTNVLMSNKVFKECYFQPICYILHELKVLSAVSPFDGSLDCFILQCKMIDSNFVNINILLKLKDIWRIFPTGRFLNETYLQLEISPTIIGEMYHGSNVPLEKCPVLLGGAIFQNFGQNVDCTNLGKIRLVHLWYRTMMYYPRHCPLWRPGN